MLFPKLVYSVSLVRVEEELHGVLLDSPTSLLLASLPEVESGLPHSQAGAAVHRLPLSSFAVM